MAHLVNKLPPFIQPQKLITVFAYLWLYSPCGPWPLFQFLNLYTVGRTPWPGDQPVARPLPTHRTTQTQNKRTDIHVSSGIRTHDPSVRPSEDSSRFRLRSHCDRPLLFLQEAIIGSLMQLNPIHTFTSDFFKIDIHIVHQSAPKSFK
jgi:hypothetical protein